MEARSRRIASLAVWALVLTVLVPLAALVAPTSAKALVTDGFDAGYIISDERFYDSGSMTNVQINDFLQAKGAKCTTNCLKSYRMATSQRDAVAGRCNGYTARSSENVANIIKNVAVSCGINPQVLLVMLEKEQGLVTATAPSASRYKIAMGYACPDTAPCDTRYYGFFNQVYMAAYQMKVYATSPSSFRYRAGQNNSIQWHPNASCGSSTVYIRNQATASLYNYTPYRPNAAALANPYGTGNSCSSYGNRNFFVKFSDWFGATTAASPEGRINSTSVEPGLVRMIGWALDRDSAASIDVHVYVNGSFYRSAAANVSRPDVGSAFPGYGNAHGFDLRLNLPPGSTEVCVYGISVGGGRNALIDCRTVSPMSGPPVGGFTLAQVEPGGVRLTGWALDPDTLAPATVAVQYRGQRVGTLTANTSSSGIDTGYPSYGTNRGFSGLVALPASTGELCLTVVNVLVGKDKSLGCRTVTVFGDSPIGKVEAVNEGPTSVRVTGWSIDRQTAAGVVVELLVNGTVVAKQTAATSRPDVGATYPAYGAKHGFSMEGPIGSGKQEVCVRAVNQGAGSSVTLKCRTFLTPTGLPQIAIESRVRSATGYTYTGYAMEPDSTTPATVRAVTSSGQVLATTTANRPHAARSAKWPMYGGQGFTIFVPLGAATADFCLTAVNVGPGSNVNATCEKWGPSPDGRLDSVSPAPGGFDAVGWAIDPDTASPIDVHIYVDGKHVSTTKAAESRPDVAGVYPAHGADHGFSKRVAATPGQHSVCVYGINVKAGKNAQFKACRVVVVPGGVPDGRINSVTPTTGGATVTGWAIDFDTASPIDVHLYVDGKMTASTFANVNRPDVGAVYPKWGAAHGFSAVLPMSKGTHEVCAYGINVGAGKNWKLACKSVTVR
ncbi:hypothetical protein ELQ90_15040 [Labedella phragmitis]|uniref:Hemagglutinin n=1 Tax=Labedella phragmitis TaxID=2498849 RepID=A0A3S3ZWQ2_9MICO|nr:hypothetical protein [Labedella phragmitis]RWZ46364.1 hypothetical protein ELQ90_15040 [Labedella phragmitis]